MEFWLRSRCCLHGNTVPGGETALKLFVWIQFDLRPFLLRLVGEKQIQEVLGHRRMDGLFNNENNHLNINLFWQNEAKTSGAEVPQTICEEWVVCITDYIQTIRPADEGRLAWSFFLKPSAAAATLVSGADAFRVVVVVRFGWPPQRSVGFLGRCCSLTPPTSSSDGCLGCYLQLKELIWISAN